MLVLGIVFGKISVQNLRQLNYNRPTPILEKQSSVLKARLVPQLDVN